MEGSNLEPEIQPDSVWRRFVRRVLFYCGVFLAIPGIGVLAWEMLLRTGHPGEAFRWMQMLMAGGFIVLANLAFTAAGKLGAPNTGNWIKGVGVACLAVFIWSQVNRNKQNQPASGKPALQGSELLRQYQQVQPQNR